MNEIPLNKPRIEYRHPDQLKPTVFEPERRLMDDPSFRELLASVRRVGIWSPLQISPEGILIDGHRRHAAAQYWKMPEVPVIVNPLGLQLGFSALNIATKPLDGRQWLDAHARGLDLVHVRAAEAKKIRWLLDCIGDDGIKRLAEMERSPELTTAAKRVASYLEWTTPDDLAAIVWWLVECDMQRPIIEILKAHPPTPPAIIADAIRRRRKLQQYWGLAEESDDESDDD